MKTIIT